jgi:hypothetical protein
MEFVPDCLQRMANRPAQLLVALLRRSKMKMECRVPLRLPPALTRGEASDQQRPENQARGGARD